MRCPYCNNIIFPDTVICPNCKKDLGQSVYEKLKQQAKNELSYFRSCKLIQENELPQISFDTKIYEVANLLLTHAGIPLVRDFHIENNSDFLAEDIQIEIGIDPPVCHTFAQNIEDLQPRKMKKFSEFYLPPNYQNFFKIKERCNGFINIKVSSQGKNLSSQSFPIIVHSYREWINNPIGLSPSIVGMVTPNDPKIEKFLSELRENFPGYQEGKPEEVIIQVQKILKGLANRNIKYTNIPVSYEGTGQKVRFPAELLCEENNLNGACLDISILLVSLFERIGLEPLLVFVESHALCGFWMAPLRALGLMLKTPFLNNGEEILDLQKQGALMLINSTSFSNNDWDLKKSIVDANEYMKFFKFALDITRIRPQQGRQSSEGITPINFIEGG